LPSYIYDADTPRWLATPRHYAYVKVAEGCDYKCSFCIIPTLRGHYRSRPEDSIVREAERLAEGGTKELLLISQDTTFYGVDRHERGALARLLRRLNRVPGLEWIRLLYLYPTTIDDDTLAAMAESEKVCKYIDLPLQHASNAVLKRMKRPGTRQTYDRLLDRIRARVPGVALRTTFIVGFPGETDDDFELLLDWLGEAQLDRVGCFKYEPVAGAVANDLAAAVPDDVKESRWHRFMQRQQAISAKRLKAKVGTRQQVIIDEVGPTVAKGRGKGDAPEIDGAIYVASRRPLRVGEIATVKIERADDYDLHGVVVGF
jgi:ribosomal protein S12 methylthiotransferase